MWGLLQFTPLSKGEHSLTAVFTPADLAAIVAPGIATRGADGVAAVVRNRDHRGGGVADRS